MGLAPTATAIAANSDKRRILLWVSDAIGGEVCRGFAATPNVVERNILLSIGASFVAAGFVSWAILQAKELMMAIADWIREATERRRERLRDEGRREGRGEGYLMGYEDRDKGKPPRPPTNGTSPNGNGDNGELR